MKVLNKATDTLTDDSIYIGRPSRFGNPFIIGKDGNRAEVLVKYENYIRNDKHLLEDIKLLKGRDLVCWCAPQSCHGDVIIQMLLEQEREELIER